MLAPNPTVQALQAARNLIADETKWCQGGLAKFVDGTVTEFALDSRIDHGVAWCAIGALMKVGVETRGDVADRLDAAATEIFPDWSGNCTLRPASYLNDATDHATVMRMFQRAIELAAAPAP